MLICQFCGHNDSSESDSFQLDNIGKGFWCEICDKYTYLNELTSKHKFTLILEDEVPEKFLFKTPNVKLSKRLSPYRYPGGKTKIVDYLFTHLQKSKSKELISPFTGGGSFELAMLHSGVVERLHLNDLDTGVFSLWWVIKHIPFALIERIKSEQPTHDDYFSSQNIIKSDYKGVDVIEAAWASLLVNRLAYSGIVKANPLGGRCGNLENLLTRWNPRELIKRIECIHSMSDRIEITQENAFNIIEESYWNDAATIFIDPPYVKKGKDLYHCYYTKEEHIELSTLLDTLYSGFPGADIVVTYDYNEWLNNLYHFPKTKVIGRTYTA